MDNSIIPAPQVLPTGPLTIEPVPAGSQVFSQTHPLSDLNFVLNFELVWLKAYSKHKKHSIRIASTLVDQTIFLVL